MLRYSVFKGSSMLLLAFLSILGLTAAGHLGTEFGTHGGVGGHTGIPIVSEYPSRNIVLGDVVKTTYPVTHGVHTVEGLREPEYHHVAHRLVPLTHKVVPHEVLTKKVYPVTGTTRAEYPVHSFGAYTPQFYPGVYNAYPYTGYPYYGGVTPYTNFGGYFPYVKYHNYPVYPHTVEGGVGVDHLRYVYHTPSLGYNLDVTPRGGVVGATK